MIPWLLYFLDGTTFFVGLFAPILALSLRLIVRNQWLVYLLNLIVAVGMALVLISAVPLPIWTYIIWGGLVLALLLWPTKVGKLPPKEERPEKEDASPFLLYLSCTAATFGIFFMELPYYMPLRLEIPKAAPVYVIGDSLSSGIGSIGEPWPGVYAAKSGHEVNNLAVPGATTKTAIEQTRRIPKEKSPIVFVEIGGNDLLGEKETNFYSDLDQLLHELSQKNCRIFLFELPLPPLGNSFGKAQRELAQKYNATLIPKRYLAQALCTGGTIDGLHLSQKGHEDLAEAIYRLESPVQQEATPQ